MPFVMAQSCAHACAYFYAYFDASVPLFAASFCLTFGLDLAYIIVRLMAIVFNNIHNNHTYVTIIYTS